MVFVYYLKLLCIVNGLSNNPILLDSWVLTMTRNELGSMELCTSDIFWLVSIIHFSLLVAMYEEILLKVYVYIRALYFLLPQALIWCGMNLSCCPTPRPGWRSCFAVSVCFLTVFHKWKEPSHTTFIPPSMPWVQKMRPDLISYPH